MVYARETEGRTAEFGVVGVKDDSLYLYDSETRSQWSQLGGEAIDGPHQGKKLEVVPSRLTTWSQWQSLHPDTTVYVRRRFPYRSRFTAQEITRFADQIGEGVGASDLVIVLRAKNGTALAYPLTVLARKTLMNEELDNFPILLFYRGTPTPVQVVSRMMGGRILRFKLTNDGEVQDLETGSTWNLETVTAVSGELTGKRLKMVPFIFSRWSAWEQYRPDTRLVTGE